MFIGLKCAIIHFLEDLAALSACLFPVLAIHTQTSIKTTLRTHWVTPSTHLSTDRYAQAPTRTHYTKPSDIPLHKFSHKNLHTNSHVQTHIFTYTHARTHTHCLQAQRRHNSSPQIKGSGVALTGTLTLAEQWDHLKRGERGHAGLLSGTGTDDTPHASPTGASAWPRT